MGCAHFFAAPPKKPLIKNSIFFQLVLKGLPLHMQTGCALGYVPRQRSNMVRIVSSSMRSI